MYIEEGHAPARTSGQDLLRSSLHGTGASTHVLVWHAFLQRLLPGYISCLIATGVSSLALECRCLQSAADLSSRTVHPALLTCNLLSNTQHFAVSWASTKIYSVGSERYHTSPLFRREFCTSVRSPNCSRAGWVPCEVSSIFVPGPMPASGLVPKCPEFTLISHNVSIT